MQDKSVTTGETMTRWSIARKKAVLQSVLSCELSFSEACAKYDLSRDELMNWMHRHEAGQTLHATRKLRVMV